MLVWWIIAEALQAEAFGESWRLEKVAVSWNIVKSTFNVEPLGYDKGSNITQGNGNY